MTRFFRGRTNPYVAIIIVVALLVWQWQTRHSRNDESGRDATTTRPDRGTEPENREGRRSDRPWLEITEPRDADSPLLAEKPFDEQPARPATGLTETERDVLRSPAGLIYVPAGRGEHRLDHVLLHSTDDPGKVVHGVFDQGDQSDLVALLDEVFEAARTGGPNVRVSRENNRTAYTVRLNRRIGYVGGESGARRGHPECRFVRLVLEKDNRVVTAFPVNSF